MSGQKAPYALHNLPEHLKDAEEIRYFAHDAAMLTVTDALEQEMDQAGVSRADMARLLGKSPAFVSQVLNGSRNMTIKTIADIALALGLQVRGIEFSGLGEMRVPYEIMDAILDEHSVSIATSELNGTYRQVRVVESRELLMAA
ncbi:MAG: helix-turn-helix transcriptional regulator [Gemmatimonadota bacterium]|nr:helix-turn-helix transcriptional regulator [Gemmatimonadota bacterium]